MLTAIVFVLGTIAIPALHLVFHALPHDHAGGEIHYASTAERDHEEQHHHEAADHDAKHHDADHHDDADHHHAEQEHGRDDEQEAVSAQGSLFASLSGLNARSSRETDQQDEHEHGEEQQPLDPRHGEGAAAHFSLAISDAAAAPFILPLHALTPAAFLPAAVAAYVTTAHVSVQRFRGPPRG